MKTRSNTKGENITDTGNKVIDLFVRVSPFKAFEQVFFDTSTDLISDRAKVLLESKKERKRIYKENNISDVSSH